MEAVVAVAVAVAPPKMVLMIHPRKNGNHKELWEQGVSE